jgi:hypothetical protein
MTRQFKLAIVRARNDSSVPVISDDACLKMLMTGRESVMRYWSDTTGGWLDFVDSAMFPWVDITVTAADTSRVTQAMRAFAALRAANPGFDPLAGFDGALVITHPGQMTVPNPMAGQPGQPATVVAGFDGGSKMIGNLPTSVVPVMPSDHTFMCHELGHTLGFNHSFGLDNNGTDWNPGDTNIIVGPEYGSPYDLMSSASFGSRWLGTGPFWTASPTFVGDSVPGWPAPGAFSMGPNMSRANLHRWFPESLDPDHTEHRPLPAPGDVGRVRLSATSTTTGRTLLVLHPPGEPDSGVGRVYVEYRDHRGWDRGLDVFGGDLARVGVVAHTIEDTAAGPRVWYRGSVVAGAVDTDLAVAGRPLVVTLDDFETRDNEPGWAEISYRQTATPAVTITTVNFDEIILGSVGTTTAKQTPCGQTITRGVWALATSAQFRASTGGFGGGTPALPVVTWTVGGTVLTGNGGVIDVPFDDAVFKVDYTIDSVSFELTLSTSHGGEHYTADIVVAVTLGAATSSASAVFQSRGFYEGYSPEDETVLSECLASIFDRANIRHQAPRFRLPIPQPPDFAIEDWRNHVLALLHDLHLDTTTDHVIESLVLLQAPLKIEPDTDASATLTALLRVGIDFSVLEADLGQWLSNTEFTPYPSLAEALLTLLKGKRLRQPVFLDVIVFNYEHTPGVASPRSLSEVAFDILKAAVLEGYNTRYGATLDDFQSVAM